MKDVAYLIDIRMEVYELWNRVKVYPVLVQSTHKDVAIVKANAAAEMMANALRFLYPGAMVEVDPLDG